MVEKELFNNLKVILLVMLILVIVVPNINAKEIVFKLNQTEYYYKVGESAKINLEIDNQYKKDINGKLTYTVTQTVNQQGSHFSSSNTQTHDFGILKDQKNAELNFGTSDQPITLDISFRYYFVEDYEKEIILDKVKIVFVSEQEQKENKEKQKKSKSKKMNNQKQNEQKQDQMSKTEQKLQNNQLNQNSNNLKQEMQKQQQELQNKEKVLEDIVSQNKEFQEMHNELLNEGYQFTDRKITPKNNNSGEFEFNYKNELGEQQKIRGDIENNTVKNISKEKVVNNQDILDKLKQDPLFQQYNKELTQKGYNETEIEIVKEDNKTKIKLPYENNEKMAAITANLVKDNIEEVKLVKEKDRILFYIILVLFMIGIFSYFVHRKYLKKNVVEEIVNEPVKEFDYVKESKKYLQISKSYYQKGELKEAYANANISLRIFLIYKNQLNKEMSNDEIINFFRKNKIDYQIILNCFNLCSLVNFAKYKPNKKDYMRIIKIVESVILK